MRPNFSPEINLGHVLQAAVVIVAVLSSAVYLRGYYDDRFAAEDQHFAAADQHIALHEMRLANDEAQLTRLQNEDDNFRTEMRNFGANLLASINDLKTQLALKEDLRRSK